ncbi:sulfatase-like hydrolase/transferase, partial [Akkermansiaceae bacterium]|nr:sulfatase-like hydrolase/transferase [Akkermansiaceae bacterium]
CSPSRATMFAGQYPHIHGVTDNVTDFPVTATTYASLLRDAGYATGYFGKWHKGKQAARPDFDTAVTFHGQGTYFRTEFFNQAGSSLFTSSATDWVDDVTTQSAVDFITAQSQSAEPFLAVVGYKRPHQPWEAPARNSDLFSDDTPIAVPNLTVPPPFAPGLVGEQMSGSFGTT